MAKEVKEPRGGGWGEFENRLKRRPRERRKRERR